jgi:23S rRNA (cytidine1920-2'-O)/16S rRNA (cytidine1409-2'-O)-methyltransferase
LVERGLFPTRTSAQAAVLAGKVRVDGVAASRAAQAVDDAAAIAVDPGPRFVSRGGEKLDGALDALAVDVAGALALDLGASTGGFTDCLLQRGAERVVALDVGYGQLDWRLRNDGRVHVMERVNARELRPQALPFVPDLVTCDLAFIGVGTVWPAVAACLDPAHRALVLVKPQFEAGRGAVGKGGVVRDPATHAEAIRRVARAIEAQGGRPAGLVASPLRGPRGNREFFLMSVGPARQQASFDLDAAIAGVVG